jgi:hypothetical protein
MEACDQRPRSRGCMESLHTHMDHSPALLHVQYTGITHATRHLLHSPSHRGSITAGSTRAGVSVAGLHELVANELDGVTCGHVAQLGHRVIACMQQHRLEGALH